VKNGKEKDLNEEEIVYPHKGVLIKKGFKKYLVKE